MDANSKWFQTLDRIDHFFSRKDDTHVVVSFSGWKPAEYFAGCEILTAAGGYQMTCDYDKYSGKTFVIFREPRAAIACRTDEE